MAQLTIDKKAGTYTIIGRLLAEPRPSSTGKTRILASTQETDEATGVKIQVNLMDKP